MSYTEIYKFNKNGDAELFSEIKNSWRGAMAIWDILDKKYLPANDKIIFLKIQDIWDLNNNPNVSKTDKICLRSTFDDVIVYKENIPELLMAFRNFEGETSLIEQSNIIEKELKNDPDLIAIAWNQTSVNGNAWESDELNENNDEYLPYNILKMNKHWSLFEDDF